MTKQLLKDAFVWSVPFSFIILGLLMSHTGTDILIVGSTMYLANHLNNLTDDPLTD